MGPQGGGDAILIDPAVVDLELITLIENNKFYIRHVLITHNHNSHTDGITTLEKIYDFKIYSGLSPRTRKDNTILKDKQVLNFGDIRIQCIHVAGHSPDSFVYSVDNMLFTGDVLSAGVIGKAPSVQARVQLLKTIGKKILPLEGDPLIFPGHGPPSSLELEKQFNPYLNGKKRFPSYED